MNQSTALLSESFQKEEIFLDVPFTVEEVHHALNIMELNKSSGPDDMTAEHLRYGGKMVTVWLTGVLNSVVDIEQVPACLKPGITIPIYKGGGKDPLDVNTVSSRLSEHRLFVSGHLDVGSGRHVFGTSG